MMAATDDVETLVREVQDAVTEAHQHSAKAYESLRICLRQIDDALTMLRAVPIDGPVVPTLIAVTEGIRVKVQSAYETLDWLHAESEDDDA